MLRASWISIEPPSIPMLIEVRHGVSSLPPDAGRHHPQNLGRDEARVLVGWLTPVAQTNRKPVRWPEMLPDELRRQRILLQTHNSRCFYTGDIARANGRAGGFACNVGLTAR